MNFYKYRKNKGFTLIEILIAMSIILLIAMAFFTILNATIRGNFKNEKEIKCMNLAQSEIENIRQQIKAETDINIEDATSYQPQQISLGTRLKVEKEFQKDIRNDNNVYYEKVIINKEPIVYGSTTNYLYTIRVIVNYDKLKLDAGKGKEFTTQVFSKRNY